MSKKLASEIQAEIEWYVDDCDIFSLVELYNLIFADNIDLLDVVDDFKSEGMWD